MLAVAVTASVLLAVGIAGWVTAGSGASASQGLFIEGPGARGIRMLVFVGATLVMVVASWLVVRAAADRRRALRHVTLVVDDQVLADATTDAVAARCGLERDLVSVTASRRALTVRVGPVGEGVVDRDRVAGAAALVLDAAGVHREILVEVVRSGVSA